MKKRVILNKNEIKGSIRKIAKEIIEKNESMKDVALVGIRTGGAFLATRLAEGIAEQGHSNPPVGVLDITLYRDDWTRIAPAPIVRKTELPFSIDNKTIILVDDVLFTGRTIRAAMDSLIDMGRPKTIQLLVLIDRGHRELPIRADYVGKVLPTSKREIVQVNLKEIDDSDEVLITEPGGIK